VETRYQVFLSSTYEDLKEERLEVIKALLELDCFPSGMEHFPAADDDQWTYIQRIIDQSDYYIVIIGGKYGSTDDEGKSYTQKEYEYAVEKGIPVIAFLRTDLSSIPSGQTDTDPESIRKLQEFRDLTKRKMCKKWTSKYELAAVASRSLSRLIKHNPRAGWVKPGALREEIALERVDVKSDSFFIENYVNNSENFQSTYRACRHLFVVGHAQNRMMVSYSSEVKRMLSEGGSVKVIVMDPEGDAVELANKRSSNPSESEAAHFQHDAALARLSTMRSSAADSNSFEVKLINLVLPYTIYGFDIHDESRAKLFVWLTPFQEPSIDRPGFSLTPSTDPRWFNFFKNQLEKLWDWGEAKPYGLK
jgi:nucleoside 2-deoxyribosyltransferase